MLLVIGVRHVNEGRRDNVISPTTLLAVAKIIGEDRQKVWQEEAKISQIFKATGATKPRLRDHLYIRIGDFLIAAGQRLQEHARPIMYSGPTVHQSGC